jgi:hypothetical protein
VSLRLGLRTDHAEMALVTDQFCPRLSKLCKPCIGLAPEYLVCSGICTLPGFLLHLTMLQLLVLYTRLDPHVQGSVILTSEVGPLCKYERICFPNSQSSHDSGLSWEISDVFLGKQRPPVAGKFLSTQGTKRLAMGVMVTCVVRVSWEEAVMSSLEMWSPGKWGGFLNEGES